MHFPQSFFREKIISFIFPFSIFASFSSSSSRCDPLFLTIPEHFSGTLWVQKFNATTNWTNNAGRRMKIEILVLFSPSLQSHLLLYLPNGGKEVKEQKRRLTRPLLCLPNRVRATEACTAFWMDSFSASVFFENYFSNLVSIRLFFRPSVRSFRLSVRRKAHRPDIGRFCLAENVQGFQKRDFFKSGFGKWS